MKGSYSRRSILGGTFQRCWMSCLSRKSSWLIEIFWRGSCVRFFKRIWSVQEGWILWSISSIYSFIIGFRSTKKEISFNFNQAKTKIKKKTINLIFFTSFWKERFKSPHPNSHTKNSKARPSVNSKSYHSNQ